MLDWYSADGGQPWVINPNLNRHVDPKDPETACKAKLLADKRFRQALSLAIDREEIIKGEYDGVGEPSQVEPGLGSPFHSERLAHAFIKTRSGPARTRCSIRSD